MPTLSSDDVDDDRVVPGVGRRAGVDPGVGGGRVGDVQRRDGHRAHDRVRRRHRGGRRGLLPPSPALPPPPGRRRRVEGPETQRTNEKHHAMPSLSQGGVDCVSIVKVGAADHSVPATSLTILCGIFGHLVVSSGWYKYL